MTMNAAHAAAAATANITVNKQLIAAESAVAQATSHLELTHALVQAHVAANEASQAAHENNQDHGVCADMHQPRVISFCRYSYGQ